MAQCKNNGSSFTTAIDITRVLKSKNTYDLCIFFIINATKNIQYSLIDK